MEAAADTELWSTLLPSQIAQATDHQPRDRHASTAAELATALGAEIEHYETAEVRTRSGEARARCEEAAGGHATLLPGLLAAVEALPTLTPTGRALPAGVPPFALTLASHLTVREEPRPEAPGGQATVLPGLLAAAVEALPAVTPTGRALPSDAPFALTLASHLAVGEEPQPEANHAAARRLQKAFRARTARRDRFHNCVHRVLPVELPKSEQVEVDAGWMSMFRQWPSTAIRRLHLRSNLDLAVELSKKDGRGEEKWMDFKYWIEAADPKHRYGAQLVPYYRHWLSTGTRDNFFHWLDEGEGGSLDLPEMPRAKLRKSKVVYLDEEERVHCEAVFCRERDGSLRLRWRLSAELVDTPRRSCFCLYRCGFPESHIFVVDFDYRLFIHRKQTGHFHHSSFLSGRPARAAGCIVVDRGRIRVVNGNSGHYKPSARMLDSAFAHFEEKHGLRRDSFLMVYPQGRSARHLLRLPSFARHSSARRAAHLRPGSPPSPCEAS